MARKKARAGRKPARKAARKAAGGKKVSPVPAGMRTVTPNLVMRNCAGAIDFWVKALGARELMRMPGPDGRTVMHAELRIGDSVVYCCDEMPQSTTRAASLENPGTCSMWLYVKDCDAAFRRAVEAGARVVMPLADMFWGDRMGLVQDPYGISWAFATHVRDVPPKEMEKAAHAAMARPAEPPAGAGI